MRKDRYFRSLDADENKPLKLRLCEKDGCTCAGEFRAPKSPYLLHDYYWFCLDHVREYNKAWDYYRDMNTEEIEASRISDVTWNRPSWPIGGWHTLLNNVRYLDGIDPVLKAPTRPPSLPRELQKSLEILELAFPVTLKALKTQYKNLAKRHHPDLNPGNKMAEEQLKTINEAYQIVKKYLTS